jgi:hypothetical protein
MNRFALTVFAGRIRLFKCHDGHNDLKDERYVTGDENETVPFVCSDLVHDV